MEIILVPSILFLVIVAPIWLSLHYRYKREQGKGISGDELYELEDMLVKVDKLADRVQTLEKILTEENPKWKSETKRSTASST
ncbi:Phage shock protein B [Thalassocella blandensis]|nr:Phage shock protein B [Thalassocella blandensis]